MKTKFENAISEAGSRAMIVGCLWRVMWEQRFNEFEVALFNESLSHALHFMGIHGYRFEFVWDERKLVYKELERLVALATDSGILVDSADSKAPTKRFTVNAGMLLPHMYRGLTGEEHKILLDAAEIAMLAYRQKRRFTDSVMCAGRHVLKAA